MAVADKSIDPVLLQCAKEEFLKEGFDNASVNVICKNAGVTTGALYKRFSSKEELFWAVVNPVINKLREWFIDEQDKFQSCDISAQVKGFDESGYHLTFLNFVYSDYDVYKIIIEKSNQSQFNNFIDYFIEIETESMIKFIKKAKPILFEKNLLSEQAIHIIMTSYFNGMMEVVRHNEKKEDALIYIEQLQKFYNISWAILIRS